MSTRSHRILPNRRLGWLPESATEDSCWLALAGFDVINMAAIYGAGSFDRWPKFDRDRYASLLPVPLNLWAPRFETEGPQDYDCGPHTTPPSLSTDALHFPLTRAEWLGHLTAASRGVCAELDETAYKEPQALLRAGFRLAKISGAQQGVDSPDFALGLALVALGNFGMQDRDECEICFRLAIPGLGRCGAHSQSKHRPDGDQSPQQNVAVATRTARKAARILDWPKTRPISLSARYYEEWTNAAVLWPGSYPAPTHVLEGIRDALHASPSAQAILPSDLLQVGFATQLEVLRSSIDPLEWLPSMWPTKILLFETWLNAQKKIAPGGPPSGLRKENMERLQLALNLLASGRSKSAIAEELGISRSHLSQLMRRGARSHGGPK